MGQYTAQMGETMGEGPLAKTRATAPSTPSVCSCTHTHTHSDLQECNRRRAVVAHRKEAGWLPDAPPGILTKDIMCWVGTFQRQPASSVAAVFLARSDVGDVGGRSSPLFHKRTAVESRISAARGELEGPSLQQPHPDFSGDGNPTGWKDGSSRVRGLQADETDKQGRMEFQVRLDGGLKDAVGSSDSPPVGSVLPEGREVLSGRLALVGHGLQADVLTPGRHFPGGRASLSWQFWLKPQD